MALVYFHSFILMTDFIVLKLGQFLLVRTHPLLSVKPTKAQRNCLFDKNIYTQLHYVYWSIGRRCFNFSFMDKNKEI